MKTLKCRLDIKEFMIKGHVSENRIQKHHQIKLLYTGLITIIMLLQCAVYNYFYIILFLNLNLKKFDTNLPTTLLMNIILMIDSNFAVKNTIRLHRNIKTKCDKRYNFKLFVSNQIIIVRQMYDHK